MSESNDECNICREKIIDKVFMSCSSQHVFCFKCILLGVEVTSKLKNCPNCRGGNKYIIYSTVGNNTDFYSLNYFKKSLPFLQKIINTPIVNTCLISESELLIYANNKKQFEAAYKLIENGYNMDDTLKLINWNRKTKSETVTGNLNWQSIPVSFPNNNFMDSISTMVTGLYPLSHRHTTQQPVGDVHMDETNFDEVDE